jgi:hypothetical protein
LQFFSWLNFIFHYVNGRNAVIGGIIQGGRLVLPRCANRNTAAMKEIA